jgi:hypothetical protein
VSSGDPVEPYSIRYRKMVGASNLVVPCFKELGDLSGSDEREHCIGCGT